MRERLRRAARTAGLGLLWAAAGYYLVFGGVYDVFDVRDLRAREEEAVARVDSLISRLDSLVRRGDSLESDPAAIERAARDRYGLIRDGERVFRFVPERGVEGRKEGT